MKNWRYFHIAWSKNEGEIKAILPLPHLLGMRFRAPRGRDQEAEGEIQMFFSTGSLVMTQKKSASRWNRLMPLPTDGEHDRGISIFCPPDAKVEFNGSEPMA